jgi:NADH-quinone oxidoreductase subunit J
VISVLLLSAMIGAIVIAKGGKQIKQLPLEKADPEKILQKISKEIKEEKVPKEEIGV